MSLRYRRWSTPMSRGRSSADSFSQAIRYPPPSLSISIKLWLQVCRRSCALTPIVVLTILRPPVDSGAPSSSHLVSPGPTSNEWGPPTPSPNTTHPPRTSGEQVSFPRVRMAGVPITPFYPPGPPLPRLRPASWGSPSRTDGQPTRSRSSADLRGNSSGEDDRALPFGGRTLPPLLIINDPWRSGVRAVPNINSSPDRSPGSEGLSITSSPPSAYFPTNYPDRGYR